MMPWFLFSLFLLPNDWAAELSALAKIQEFNGVIVVRQGKAPPLVQSHGFADPLEQRRFEPEALFPIASITKWFTAALILQLVEEGKLQMDQQVREILPEFQRADLSAITVKHLLTHSSGLTNNESIGEPVDGVSRIYSQALSLDRAIRDYCLAPTQTKAGTAFAYNNGDYLILGKILEKIRAKPFHEILKAHILDPLAMTNTGMIANLGDKRALVSGFRYDREKQTYQPNPPMVLENYFAAGGMYANATDLMRFVDGFFGGKLFDPQTMALFLNTYPESRGYAAGVWVRYMEFNQTVAKVVQRYGRIWGINHYLAYYVDQDLTILVLGNTDQVSPASFQRVIAEALLP